MSMPNLRKVGGGAAPFVPVTLVQENWVGAGLVAGKTPAPTSGDGTWQENTSGLPLAYSGGSAFPDAASAGTGIFRHSVTLTDASIFSIVTPGVVSGTNAAVTVFARSTPGPTGNITDAYLVVFTTGGVSLRKRVSDIETELATDATNPTDLSTLFTVSGSTLTVKVNNVQVIQVTDTSISTAGYWGYGLAFAESGEELLYAAVGPVTIQTA